MTSTSALNSRMRKVERKAGRNAPSPFGTVLIAENDAAEAQQLTELEAAGTYKPG